MYSDLSNGTFPVTHAILTADALLAFVMQIYPLYPFSSPLSVPNVTVAGA